MRAKESTRIVKGLTRTTSEPTEKTTFFPHNERKISNSVMTDHQPFFLSSGKKISKPGTADHQSPALCKQRTTETMGMPGPTAPASNSFPRLGAPPRSGPPAGYSGSPGGPPFGPQFRPQLSPTFSPFSHWGNPPTIVSPPWDPWGGSRTWRDHNFGRMPYWGLNYPDGPWY